MKYNNNNNNNNNPDNVILQLLLSSMKDIEASFVGTAYWNCCWVAKLPL